MKKLIITLWMLVAISTLDVFGQAGIRPGESTLSAMEKLRFLEGNWTGEGWIQMGPEKHQFVQEETVTRKVNNAVLVIYGLGRDAETQKVIRRAVPGQGIGFTVFATARY